MNRDRAWQRSKQDCIERRYNCVKNASTYFCTEAGARSKTFRRLAEWNCVQKYISDAG